MGLIRLSQGKVRDTWSLRNLLGHDKFLLVVASDRISIFDYVLKALVPLKGVSLTVLTHFWLTEVLKDFPHHLIPSKMNKQFNFAYDLRMGYLSKLPIERCLVVENLSGQMYPAELIFRGHVGGSIWPGYLENGIVAGQQLPLGLQKWSKLDEPIFTPSTKAEFGNDINKDVDYFYNQMKNLGKEDEARQMVKDLKRAYEIAYAYAQKKGIIILDTKFEVGGKLADEILTPDSSRFAEEEDWKLAMEKGRDPKFLDKQPVRDWGATVLTPFLDDNCQPIIGINKLKSENPEYEQYIEFVQNLEIPDWVISEAAERYPRICKMITGYDLDDYLKNCMGAELRA
ncbi:MAG: phosphoribosylaminoimidazolesuccinocarboxamide synthase [Patescibacteria group bacterium]